MNLALPLRLVLMLSVLLAGMASVHAHGLPGAHAMPVAATQEAAPSCHEEAPAPAAADDCCGASCDCTCAVQLTLAALLPALSPAAAAPVPAPLPRYRSVAPPRLLRPPIA